MSEGAGEIDIVITRAHVLNREWTALYDEVKAMREACGAAHLKAILATGDLKTLRNVYSREHGGDAGGRRFHQDLHRQGGRQRDLAGQPDDAARAARLSRRSPASRSASSRRAGLRTAKDALNWLILMKEELGLPWMRSDLFRIGASSLLTDIERQLSHYATGRYSANYRHAMA